MARLTSTENCYENQMSDRSEFQDRCKRQVEKALEEAGVSDFVWRRGFDFLETRSGERFDYFQQLSSAQMEARVSYSSMRTKRNSGPGNGKSWRSLRTTTPAKI